MPGPAWGAGNAAPGKAMPARLLLKAGIVRPVGRSGNRENLQKRRRNT